MAPERVVERVLTRVWRAGDCLVSTYSVDPHGYPQVGWGENDTHYRELCHKVVWESINGPRPTELVIDHVCHNRRCVNPAHLRLLSREENSRDNGWATKTQCPHGHPYDETNTITRRGRRECRVCKNRRERKRYQRRKAA